MFRLREEPLKGSRAGRPRERARTSSTRHVETRRVGWLFIAPSRVCLAPLSLSVNRDYSQSIAGRKNIVSTKRRKDYLVNSFLRVPPFLRFGQSGHCCRKDSILSAVPTCFLAARESLLRQGMDSVCWLLASGAGAIYSLWCNPETNKTIQSSYYSSDRCLRK